MKHIIILLLGLSCMPLLAQEDTKIAAYQRCPMNFYHRTDTANIKINGPALRARAVNTLLINYQCEEAEGKLLNEKTLYLVISDHDGKMIQDERYDIPTISINGYEIQPYAQGLYRSDTGIAFEVVPPSGKWVKGTVYLFNFYHADSMIKKKHLLFN